MNSLFYKPCFGRINFNFTNKKIIESSDSYRLKVFMPITWLIPAKSVSFLKCKKIR
jgi:hypothetical protein